MNRFRAPQRTAVRSASTPLAATQYQHRAHIATALVLLCVSNVVSLPVGAQEPLTEARPPDWLADLMLAWTENGRNAQVEMQLRNELSPWSAQTYLIRHRGGALASLTLRSMDASNQALSRVALLTDLAWESVGPLLLECQAEFGTRVARDSLQTAIPVETDMLVDPPPWERVTGVEWTFRLDRQEHSVTWSPPFSEPQHRCVSAFRALFHEAAGPVEIAWPWVDPATWGTFQSHTQRPARLWVDGWPTAMVTPVDQLPLPEGVHEVVWRDVQTGDERRETVRIEAGRVTRMDVSVP